MQNAVNTPATAHDNAHTDSTIAIGLAVESCHARSSLSLLRTLPPPGTSSLTEERALDRRATLALSFSALEQILPYVFCDLDSTLSSHLSIACDKRPPPWFSCLWPSPFMRRRYVEHVLPGMRSSRGRVPRATSGNAQTRKANAGSDAPAQPFRLACAPLSTGCIGKCSFECAERSKLLT